MIVWTILTLLIIIYFFIDIQVKFRLNNFCNVFHSDFSRMRICMYLHNIWLRQTECFKQLNNIILTIWLTLCIFV